MPGERRACPNAAPRWFRACAFGVGLLLVGSAGCGSSHHAPADAAGDRAAGDGAAAGGGDAPGGGGGDAVAGGDSRAAGDIRGDGGATADAPPGADGATADGIPVDGGFGAGCNTLTTGATVNVTCAGDGGVPIAPAGGAIVPGTYVLTAVTAYGPCLEIAVAQTLVVTANTVQAVIDDPINGFSRANASYAISGTDMVQTNTCPNSDRRTLGFTSVAAGASTTLILFSTDQGTNTVATLTLQ